MSAISGNNPLSNMYQRPTTQVTTNNNSTTAGVGQNNSNAEEVAALFSDKKQDADNKNKKSSKADPNLQKKIQKIEQAMAVASALDIAHSVDQKSEQILKLARSGNFQQSWADDEKEQGVETAETFLSLKAAYLKADSATKPEIEKVLKNFTDENSTSIQTSFNVAAEVSKAYSDQTHAQTMRKVIGEGNQNNHDVRSILTMLLDHFGEDDFEKSFNTYSKSILTDMRSLVPSTDPKKLSDVFENLHKANGVRSFVSECDDFLLDFKQSNSETKQLDFKRGNNETRNGG